MPGEFHASEAAHLVAAADKDGDKILSKEEVDSQKSIFVPDCIQLFLSIRIQGGGCVQDLPGLAGNGLWRKHCHSRGALNSFLWSAFTFELNIQKFHNSQFQMKCPLKEP